MVKKNAKKIAWLPWALGCLAGLIFVVLAASILTFGMLRRNAITPTPTTTPTPTLTATSLPTNTPRPTSTTRPTKVPPIAPTYTPWPTNTKIP